jgi:homoserine dehydrogenase
MPQINVALLGFGNVGRSFAEYVDRCSSNISIRTIADTSGCRLFDDSKAAASAIAHKKSGKPLSEFERGKYIADARDFIRALPASGIPVLVESLPTHLDSGEPALGLLTAALEQGTSVVTVDKGPVVHGFEALKEAARKGGASLGYSGTTGITIPNEIATDRVLEIRGVLNGTTNYVLTAMQERGISFGDALAAAQTTGIAEPDATLDVEGWDTAAKILILAKSLMGADTRLADVSRIGIGPETDSLIRIARETGRVVRLIGRARFWQGRIRLSVAPKLVVEDSPFYSVSGGSKAAMFRTEGKADVFALGRSGRDAISETIVDDIARIAEKLS